MADPPLRAKLVAGVQWAVTGFYVFALGFLAVGWYLSATRRLYSLSVGWELAGFLAAAFLGGYFWAAGRGNGVADETHARRIEVTLSLLVLGFVVPAGALGLLDLLGSSVAEFPFAVPGAAYAVVLAVAYGLVYGVGVRPFFGGSEP